MKDTIINGIVYKHHDELLALGKKLAKGEIELTQYMLELAGYFGSINVLMSPFLPDKICFNHIEALENQLKKIIIDLMEHAPAIIKRKGTRTEDYKL